MRNLAIYVNLLNLHSCIHYHCYYCYYYYHYYFHHFHFYYPKDFPRTIERADFDYKVIQAAQIIRAFCGAIITLTPIIGF